MRIVAGEFRGRELLGPKSNRTRPITDRAKQSLFDTLTVAMPWAGVRVLDCFCGTGSLGLESLSRGAARAVFVERDRGALDRLRNNINRLCVIPRCRVLPLDAYRLPAALQAAGAEAGRFDLAFVDPPYAHWQSPGQHTKVRALLVALAGAWMAPNGLIILRHPAAAPWDAVESGLRMVRRLQYGSMGLTWLRGPDLN